MASPSFYGECIRMALSGSEKRASFTKLSGHLGEDRTRNVGFVLLKCEFMINAPASSPRYPFAITIFHKAKSRFQYLYVKDEY